MALSWTVTASDVARPELSDTDAVNGRDIYFNGDYQVTASGDYLTVDGDENLRAAVYRRLFTKPGDYAVRPDYGAGLQQFVKKRATRSEIDKLKSTVINQLLQDPRIDETLEVNIERTTLNSVPITKVYVKIVSKGRALNFRPFVFALGTVNAGS